MDSWHVQGVPCFLPYSPCDSNVKAHVEMEIKLEILEKDLNQKLRGGPIQGFCWMHG